MNVTRTVLAGVMGLAFLSPLVHAQWLHYPTPGIPRLRDGKPNLFAPAPRTTEGRPDLSGVWTHEITSPSELKRLYGDMIDAAAKADVPGMEIGSLHKYAINILGDFTPQESPMRPAAVELMRRRIAARDPASVCTEVVGFPAAGLVFGPIKIVQSRQTTVVLYEAGRLYRQVFTDGRGLPKEFEFPAFLGYSIGRWPNDILIVDTAGFNDKARLDVADHPHSKALRTTERFRRVDFGHMIVDTTFDDPQIYTKPFTITVRYDLLADADIFESFCENEKDRAHLKRP
jgi:hypothetical protein